MVAVSSLASPVSAPAIVRGGRVGNAGVATSGTHRTRRRAHPLRRRRRAAVVVDAAAATHALGVDVGTQGTKAIIYDLSSKTVAGKGSCAYGLMPQPEGRPHFAEQDPDDWLEGIRVAVKQALDDARCDPSAIASVGVSAQQHGMVALDANGALVRPAKLWCDVESSSEAKELAGHFGWDIQAGFTASKVLWMIRNEPNNWSRTAHVLLPHDWINYKLTGVLAMERGDASGIGVMDVNTREFDETLCSFVDPRFRSTLPDLVPPEGTIGVVTTEASRGWLAGLVPPGAEVSVGSGDNMMSALGAGCVNDGELVVSLGTSGTVFGYSSTAVMDTTGAVAPFCDATGGYLPLLCTMNCTKVVEEPCRWYGRDHDEMVKLAESVPPGCDGVRFLPYLTGERSPNWPDATGALVGLRPGMLANPAVAYRAAVEGVTYSLLAGVKRMSELGLPSPDAVKVVGGGSKSTLWRQTIADAFGVPVRRPVEGESAALGAAMQAAAALENVNAGTYVKAHPPGVLDEVETPDADAVDALREGYALFVEEGRALFEK